MSDKDDTQITRIHFHLSVGLKKAAADYAAEQGGSVSEVCRQALREYLGAEGKPKKRRARSPEERANLKGHPGGAHGRR